MRRPLLILISFLFYTQIFSITIKSFQFIGLDQSDERTILNYFYEYQTNKIWMDDTALSNDLERFGKRLERTGWFRNISISHALSHDEAYVTVTLTERIPYSAWFGNLYLGVSRYNLWGKGKTIKFEIGLNWEKIILEDLMFNYSPFSYSITLGNEQASFFNYTTNTYAQNTVFRKMANISLGAVLLPDIFCRLISQNYFLSETNSRNIGSYHKMGFSLEYDRRAGYPAVYEGADLFVSSCYIYPENSVQLESSIEGYYPFLKGLVLAGRAHLGYLSGYNPDYIKFYLRNIDGLRTLSQYPGLLGNFCWDIHSELRWAFWDLIPFVIFDMQLEALAFVEAGEARDNVSEMGRPHYVYGSGLRIYIDTFAIRVEAGVDETSAVSILTSFNLPF
jgi:hypothetical protein